MVKTLRIAFLAVAGLVLLAGCSLGYSIFPGALMSYEGYADLAGYIDRDRIWEFNFQIIRNSTTGAEYLVLANDNDDFGGVHVAIYDANLKVLGKFTMDELDAMDALPYSGRGAMVDYDGKIVVGNRRFTVSARKVVFADSLSQVWNLGLAVPEGFDQNITDIRAENNELRYRRYQAGWTFTTSEAHPVGFGLSSKVVGVWHRGTDIALVIFHDVSPAHVIRINPLSFATGGYGNVIGGGLDTPISLPPNVSWETLGYTDQGFAVFRRDTGQYVRFDEWGFPIGVPFDVTGDEWPHEQRHVYGRTAGWYIFKLKEMTLERRAWWWLP